MRTNASRQYSATRLVHLACLQERKICHLAMVEGRSRSRSPKLHSHIVCLGTSSIPASPRKAYIQSMILNHDEEEEEIYRDIMVNDYITLLSSPYGVYSSVALRAERRRSWRRRFPLGGWILVRRDLCGRIELLIFFYLGKTVKRLGRVRDQRGRGGSCFAIFRSAGIFGCGVVERKVRGCQW